MAAPKRPPITCHILDTTTGTPAPNVSVTLTLIEPLKSTSSLISAENTLFISQTNSDGRVESWTTTTASLEELLSKQDELLWNITFEIGEYYRQKEIRPFFPKVEIQFITGGEGQEGRSHYHIPLLVGPYSYTTYRGS
ncbi:Hydroxyisourate hydrolase [Rhizodiscina lignyota]|uniref:5-hydroxyisourate hydrolase n=1 Tax=Rhizodiscina lignyota TaxID=1504668 RepID=A0A9P4I7S2_9PEZI|nr:Hydroxyisourate hydrolase [Rhizodiscina lignyota]